MSTPTAAPSSAPAPLRAPHPLLVALLIGILALLAYGGVGDFGFVNLDDDAYVETNPLVNQGFRPAAIVWALTGSHSSNWHPLTTLSHILDCQLFGVNPRPMHWENVAWHALNAMLVFAVWRALTGAVWRPATVAALFALHPLHVESVAWISERKDVLSAFFWLLGLWAYARYARAPSIGRSVLVALAMIGALLSKPMAVTFPCTLLLLDFWPLRRWPQHSWRWLFWEKLPLFGLVAVHSVLTFFVQRASGAANYGERFSLGARIANALVAYARYLGKTLWPENLSAFYAHPGAWPTLVVVGATVLLLLLTATAWALRRTRPWLLFGWLWFLGTLVPVIGLIQVGAQSMADRYMYLPILGIFTLLVWQSAALLPAQVMPRRVAFAATAAALVALAFATARQARAWTNSLALYDHSIAVGEDNATVRYLRAVALSTAQRPITEVVEEFRNALRRQPDYVNAMTQLASIAMANRRFPEAQQLIEESVRVDPKNPGVHANLGAVLRQVGATDEAIPHLERALALDPKCSGAHLELGLIALQRNQPEIARRHYQARADAEPWNADVLCDYGTLLANLGRLADAVSYLERAVWIRPDHARAKENLAATKQLLQQPRQPATP